MPDYTLVASDIITSMTTEGQTATTNRSVLLDYLNRVHQRILRESQWAFLKSDRQYFLTVPGAQNYWVGDVTQKPLRSVETGLNLVDFDNLLLDTVEDESYGHNLSFASARVRNVIGTKYQDGQDTPGMLRSFSVQYDEPGDITLHPMPDDNNQYQPVPSSPVAYFSPSGYLPPRLLYIVCTLVDTNGGESVQSAQPTIISVPTGQLVTVAPPERIVGSAIGILYTRWNIYVGTSLENLTLQNEQPIPVDQTFTESIFGFGRTLYPSSTYSVDPTYYLGVTDNGLLQQTIESTYIPDGLILADTSGVRWQFTKDANGILSTLAVPNTVVTPSIPFFYLMSSEGYIWRVSVATSGLLQTTASGTGTGWTPQGTPPPGDSTIVPMNGNLISFRYNVKRKILAMTDTLQVPTIYRDVVIAGISYYATSYLKSDPADTTASRWYQEFMIGLGQIRKDIRLMSKTTDMILPDQATQYRSYSEPGPF